MICSALAALPVPGFTLACQAGGIAVGAAQIIALLATLVSTFWALTGAKPLAHRLGGLSAALAALLLAVAAGLPTAKSNAAPPAGGRVAVLLDLSESMRREGDDRLEGARKILVRRIDEGVSGRRRDADGTEVWQGRVFGFTAGRQPLSQPVPVSRLAATAAGVQTGSPGNASDLAGGLAEAINWISQGPGPGEVYLLTDGWFTEDAPGPEISRAAGRGIPIHVLAYGAERTSQGLIAWDLGPEQVVSRPAVARLVTRGPGTIEWNVDGVAGEPVSLAPGDTAQPVRLPVIFPARGFSHLAVVHSLDGRSTRQTTEFTLVRGPARLLVFGSGLWANNLPPARYSVTISSPDDTRNLSDYDIVALDGLEPSDFPDSFVKDLVSSASGGTGLFIINGPLRGQVTDPQRMADWEATALGPILPVNSDPDYVLQSPPPRTVLIIIDTSGSMSGENATRARQAAHRILEFLRPQDSLTILPFSDGVGRPFEATSMSPGEASRAKAYIDRLAIGGGTNMNAAITAAARLRGTNCDLFVIGDGGYPAGQVNTSPICKTTAIGVEGRALPGFDTRWGQQIPLGPGQQLGAIKFETFEPEPRLEFWRNGPLELRPVDSSGPFGAGGRVAGLSLAYARPESDVVLIPGSVPPDPALVFREDTQLASLHTGVFMGDLKGALPETTLLAALDRLTGWSEPDRFDIRLRMETGKLVAQIATVDGWPTPDQLSMSLRYPDGRSVPFDLEPGDQAGTFHGNAIIALGSEIETAILTLRTGDSRAQSIPMRLPRRDEEQSRASVQEKDSMGVNAAVLSEILDQTGGVDLSSGTPRLRDSAFRPDPIDLWPVLAAFALCFFTLGLWLGGARR